MKLYLSTASHSEIILELRQGKELVARRSFEAAQAQAEKLLPAIEKLLAAKKLGLGDLKGIVVETAGAGFSSLRIGVATANALAYTLSLPLFVPGKGRVAVAVPAYSRPPSITTKKR